MLCRVKKPYAAFVRLDELFIDFCKKFSAGGERLADKVSVSGIVPVESGDNWFAIDKSGDFSLDKTVDATIWLVGGGCDGGAGSWIGYDSEQLEDGTWRVVEGTGTGTSYAGKGGDGGYVYTAVNVKIPKGENCSAVIAAANDKSGTSLVINGVTYKCNGSGHSAKVGGKGGGVELSTVIIQPTDGQDGVSTPYQVVGSSGGGGLSCNGFNVTPDDGNVSRIGEGGIGAGSTTEHRSPGTDAENYGCGGGGGAICGQIGQGQLGGKGKQGCIIISYTVEQKALVVQKHYKRVCNTHKTCKTDYYSSSSSKSCCGNNRCGCGNSRSANASDYIDTIHIGSGKGK